MFKMNTMPLKMEGEIILKMATFTLIIILKKHYFSSILTLAYFDKPFHLHLTLCTNINIQEILTIF